MKMLRASRCLLLAALGLFMGCEGSGGPSAPPPVSGGTAGGVKKSDVPKKALKKFDAAKSKASIDD